MKSVFLGLVAALAVVATLAPTAYAGRLNTSTCPATGNVCVGGGR